MIQPGFVQFTRIKDMTRGVSYKLSRYKIIEEAGGGLWWEAHSGVGNAQTGRCYVEGNILIIGPTESENPGFLKQEFMEHLDQLPRWEKTEFYCLSHSIYRCRTGGKLSAQSKLSARLDLSLKTMESDGRNEGGEVRQDGPKQSDISRVIASIKEKTLEIRPLLKRWWRNNRR